MLSLAANCSQLLLSTTLVSSQWYKKCGVRHLSTQISSSVLKTRFTVDKVRNHCYATMHILTSTHIKTYRMENIFKEILYSCRECTPTDSLCVSCCSQTFFSWWSGQTWALLLQSTRVSPKLLWRWWWRSAGIHHPTFLSAWQHDVRSHWT